MNLNNYQQESLQGYERRYRSLRTFVVCFGIIATVAMLFLVVFSVFYIASLASEIEKISNLINAAGSVELTISRNSLLSADYLAIGIPVLVAFIGSMIAFLGMNRLKMFDERIDGIRVEMLSEIDTRVKNEVASSRSDFTESIMIKFDEKEKQLIDDVTKIRESVQKESAEGQKAISDAVKQFGDHFGWLKVSGQVVGELSISTVADAHDMVEKLQQEKPENYIEMIKRIVDKVCAQNDSLSVDSNDYHNLSAELASGNMYYEAIRVLEKGLIFFNEDTDLLSDTIEYATKNSQFSKAREAVDRLVAIEKWRWTWRCYEFAIDYYRAVGEIEKAYNLCEEFIVALPYDEHGYRSKAELEMIKQNGEKGIQIAIKILVDALDKGVNGAQCAQKLADIYLSKGEFQNAIDASTKAIMESAQEQPHIGLTRIIATRGFAYDRLFMSRMIAGKIEKDLATMAREDYQAALAFCEQGIGHLPPVTIKQIVQRLFILNKYKEQ